MRLIRNWYKLLAGTGLVANDDGPGAAQGTLTANVTWLDYLFIYPDGLTLAGVLDPDATGIYLWTGTYNNKPYCALNSSWFLWWSIADTRWYISTAVGVTGADFWEGGSTTPLGLFEASGGAAGNGTLTGDTLEEHKGVTIAASVSRIVTPAAAGFPAAAGSIEMLVRPSWNYNDGIAHYLWDTYQGSNRRFLLAKGAANTTYLYTDNTYRGAVTFQWAANTLYHVVLNWGTNTLYVNNVLVKTFDAAGLGLGAANLYIGDTCSGANSAFSGIIYYFIARDVAMTPAEITTFKAFFENLYIAHPD